MKVFLGGTVNNSKWRDEIIPRLKIDFFNPVVSEWTDDAYQRELYERETCDYLLYVITPRITGFYGLAEVTDDSFKRPDATIFCYLPHDDEYTFTAEQLQAMESLSQVVTRNGGIHLNSLGEVVEFLNSAKEIRQPEKKNTDFFDVFISYGRQHSKDFAVRLHNDLTAKGYHVYLDQNNIPLAVDFQSQIDEGIERSHNFIFVISPHSVKSKYCRKEVVLADKYNKRIIPLLHVDPSGVGVKMHATIERLNWIFFRDDTDPWKNSFDSLCSILNSHTDYVHTHTTLLGKALEWERNMGHISYLLTGSRQREALEWLTNDFGNTPPPCQPSDQHYQFIIESKKMADNRLTDVFFCYAHEDVEMRDRIRKGLMRNGITHWSDDTDIRIGVKFDEAIKEGIENADNFLYLLSPNSIVSPYCLAELEHAQLNKKRIIPLKVEDFDESTLPANLRFLQYFDFSILGRSMFQKA